MKKTISLLILITVLASLLLLQPSQSGYAQGEPTPSPTPYPGESEFITLDMLGIEDEVMIGPYASSYIRFSTPASWALDPGGIIILDLETVARSSRTFTEETAEFSGATLEVVLNDHVVDVILLHTGQETVELLIPDEARYPTRADGRHSLRLFLDATIDCLFDHETSVVVRAESGFSLPHHDTSPTTNLTLLPSPIYKKDSLLPEETILLLPDSPTAKELQSAMTIAAGFGRMTGGDQVLIVTNASTITEAQKKNAHLVIVGKNNSLPILNEVIFPATVTGEYPTQTVEANDGILQMAPSPWNDARIILYIGGEEDEAVVKAAQAFSSGALRVGNEPSLSVVSSVAESIETEEVAEDRTLESLGYQTQTLSGIGYNDAEYEFLIPLGKETSGEATFTLSYAHSATFDFDASGAIILINGEVLGSIRFKEESANKLNDIKFDIPAYAIRPGRNILTVQAEFVPLDYCSQLNDTGLWMSVNQDSLLRIPLVEANKSITPYIRDLGLYPIPFIDSPTLGELSFVFPANDINSWNVGASIASDLGKYAVGQTLNLSSFYADDVPNDIRANNHLIIVGLPSTLPIINELTEVMPAYFEENSNMPIEDSYIHFTLPKDTDMGYIELFPAPENPTRSILAVLGSTPLGLEWAKVALLDPTLKQDMQGNYVVAQNDKIYTIDTRLGGETQNITTATPDNGSPTPIPGTVPPTSYAYQQDWVLTAIMVISGGILLLLIGLVIRALRRKRNAQKK